MIKHSNQGSYGFFFVKLLFAHSKKVPDSIFFLSGFLPGAPFFPKTNPTNNLACDSNSRSEE